MPWRSRGGEGRSCRLVGLLLIITQCLCRLSAFQPPWQVLQGRWLPRRGGPVVRECAASRARPALELYADSTLAQESKDYLDGLFDTLHKSRALGNGVKVLQVTHEIMEKADDLSPKHCTMLVTALSAVGLGKHTVAALETMKSKGLQLNKVTYGAVINACSYAQDIATAKRVMQEMRDDGIAPDAMEYSSLLHGLKRMNKTEECIACFQEMVQMGIRPTTRTYDGLLGALSGSERWDDFFSFSQQMLRDGVAFSAITYHMALRGADRTGDSAGVLKLYARMVSEGFSPTASISHLVVKAGLALGELEQATEAMQLLILEHAAVKKRLYSNLLQSLVAANQLSVARGLLQEVQSRRHVELLEYLPTAAKGVLTDCVKRRRSDQGYAFLEALGNMGVEVDEVCFNNLMDSALKAKRPGRVWELLRMMRQRGVSPGLITYNIMLNACAVETDGGDLAIDVWRDFKSSGLWPDRILYLSLMRAMAPWTVEPSTVFALLDDAEGGKIPLDTQMANYALRLLAGSREVGGVEEMLRRMVDRGVERDVVSWTTAIKACLEAGDWAKALQFLVDMREDGVEPNEITYATAIHVLGQAGRWEEALKLLDAMEGQGLRNVVAYTSAMGACENAGAYAQGLAVWERMLQARVKVTTPAIDVVLKICERAGEEEMAARVLEKTMDWGLLGRRSHVRKVLRFIESLKGRQAMIQYVEGLFRSGRLGKLDDEGRFVVVEALCDQGLVRHALYLLQNPLPTRLEVRHALFSQVIAAAAVGGAPDLVLSVYDSMQADKIAFGKDVYQAVLIALKTPHTPITKGSNAAAAAAALEKARRARKAELVGRMLEDCRSASISDGNEVLAACVGAKDWDLGTVALVEVGKRRLAFDVDTYRLAIAILAEKREGPRAVQLLREMEARGFAPRTAEYNHAMQACLDRHSETALELFRELQQPGCSVSMDTGSVMAALGACRAARDTKLIASIVGVATAHGLAPSLIIYNAVLGVYAATQQVDKVIDVLEEMRDLGIRADEFTYNTAIGAFAKVGDYRQALRWLSMMGIEGVAASTVTYNCVIDACAHGGNPGKAAEIFAEMKERKVPVDHVTYGSLANAFAKSGQWEAAVKVLEEMRARPSLRPNNFVYCSVMSACNRSNQWTVALALLDQLLKKDGLEPDLYTCNEALNACARGGIWEKALEILALARRLGMKPDTISFNKALQACIAARRWTDAQALIMRMDQDKVPYDRTTHNLLEEINIHSDMPVKALQEENVTEGFDFFD